jgi:membrane protein implicated in regulation of membrane protease activity
MRVPCSHRCSHVVASAESIWARSNGQVRLGGEVWGARCELGAEPGDEVVVRVQDGLTLIVEQVVARDNLA